MSWTWPFSLYNYGLLEKVGLHVQVDGATEPGQHVLRRFLPVSGDNGAGDRIRNLLSYLFPTIAQGQRSQDVNTSKVLSPEKFNR